MHSFAVIATPKANNTAQLWQGGIARIIPSKGADMTRQASSADLRCNEDKLACYIHKINTNHW